MRKLHTSREEAGFITYIDPHIATKQSDGEFVHGGSFMGVKKPSK